MPSPAYGRLIGLQIGHWLRSSAVYCKFTMLAARAPEVHRGNLDRVRGCEPCHTRIGVVKFIKRGIHIPYGLGFGRPR